MPRKYTRRIRAGVLLLSLAAALALLLAGPGCGGGPSPESDASGLTPVELSQAQRLYAQMVREYQLHRDRKTLEIAANLLDYHSRFPRNDEVLAMAIESSVRLGETARARQLVAEMLTEFPGSPLIDQALQKGADLAAAAQDTVEAAWHLVRLHDRQPAVSTRPDGRPEAAVYLEALSGAELASLAARVPDSGLLPYLNYLRVRDHLAHGELQPAQALVAQMNSEAPADGWTLAARELVADPSALGRQVRRTAGGPVQIERIGLLAPLTERYALLGNAFVDAALLAVEAANLEMETRFELRVEDTAGDPVIAALAARRLCAEEGVAAMLGALLSAPTAATALVCDTYGVPLISPTATNEGVWRLGDGIFQTNLTGLFEIRLLAQVATQVLLKERFAVLYPDDPEGRQAAEDFSAEVTRLGGQVVAQASFPAGGTDFRAPILELREHRPEVIFTPATVDQMVMLGPQMDFYKSGSLVLGLSHWNSDRLVERAGGVLEDVLLPSDLAMFRPQWTEEFYIHWDENAYPGEATPQALKAYQATRMLLETIHQSGATDRVQVTEALRGRLASRQFDAQGLDSFENSVRMFRGGRIVRFPARLFAEAFAWEQARADSLAPADSLGLEVQPVRPETEEE